MRLKFVSGKRVLKMGSGFDASIIEIKGMGLPEKRYNTQKYVGMAGQVTLGTYVLPREIEIKGDICLKGGMKINKFHTFFDNGGVLYILNKRGRKKIEYNPVSLETDEVHGDYVAFTLKLICDFPYFSDSVNEVFDIYKRVDMINGAFSLPKVFTKRTTDSDIYNKGQIASEPVISIECIKEGEFSGGIVIQKGKKVLKLNTSLTAGEVLTIDIKNRNISSNKRQNCFGILDENCLLSGFVLDTGINNISVSNSNDGEIVATSISFDNLYSEAM